MNVPPKEKPQLGGEGLDRLTTCAVYPPVDFVQVGVIWSGWQREAVRLLSQYWRTNDPKHLVAFVVHVRGMRAYASSAT
jgi:hypothetical protein